MQIQSNLPVNVSVTTSSSKTNEKTSLNDILTKEDKALVSEVYGNNWQQKTGVNGNLETNYLADIIAISRSLGTLKGPVTINFLAPYLNNNDAVSNTIISRALNNLSENSKENSSSSKISFNA